MRKLLYAILFFLSLTVRAADEKKLPAMVADEDNLPTRAADDEKFNLSVSADVVSTYVWRGSYQAGTSIQPCMEFTAGGFSIGAWGSVDIAGFGYKEMDLMAYYSFKNVTAGIFDYWVAGEMNYRFFDFSKSTQHLLDAWLTYDFNRLPLTVGWYTIVAGDEQFSKYEKKGKMKKAFPTYIEAIYTFPVKEVNLEATIGVSPWNSGVIYNRADEGGHTNGFAVVNLSLKASKDIKITEHYAFPVYGQLILNPAKEDLFLVFGIKF